VSAPTKWVELVLVEFPDAKDERDRKAWFVRIVCTVGVLQSVAFFTTTMCNYWPKTFDEMVEQEARQAAEGTAKKLGIPLMMLVDS
jgi:hypothetical protein